MSNVHHHPQEETLAAYAAGSLTASLALVIGCHLESCAQCRKAVAAAENLGGVMMDELQPSSLSSSARSRMLAMLDDAPLMQSVPQPRSEPIQVDSRLPRKLHKLLGNSDLENQHWKSLGPGVKQLKLPCKEGTAILLNIEAHKAVPVHSHKGSELTLILEGDYNDHLGHFGRGDIADLDTSTQHQPVAGPQGCICLAGMDAPLRFQGLLPRLLQPFFGI